MARNNRSIDYTGKVYGELLVLRRISAGRWWCRCSCGLEKSILIANIVNGTTKTCGHGRAKRGGSTRHPEYMVWFDMVDRCHNPKSPAYKDYGSRGISVCQEWQKDYMKFLSHIGRRPTANHTLDRKDNNGNYAPGNVRWATMKEQSNNRRSNRLITLQGTTKTAQQWIETYPHLKGRRDIIYKRTKAGWSEERAILTPVRAKRH